MKKCFLFPFIILFLSGCAAAPVITGAAVGELAIREGAREEIAKKVVIGKLGTEVEIPGSYFRRLEVVRKSLSDADEFPLRVEGKKYKAFVQYLDVGTFRDKLRVVIVSPSTSKIRIWGGKTYGRFIVSEDPLLEKDVVEEIKCQLKK